jgi:hypothetical protein
MEQAGAQLELFHITAPQEFARASLDLDYGNAKGQLVPRLSCAE